MLSVGTGFGTGTGLVKDNTTGLTWMQFPAAAVKYTAAVALCSAMGGTWSLPPQAQAVAISGTAYDPCAFPADWDTWVQGETAGGEAYWVTNTGDVVMDEAAATASMQSNARVDAQRVSAVISRWTGIPQGTLTDAQYR